MTEANTFFLFCLYIFYKSIYTIEMMASSSSSSRRRKSDFVENKVIWNRVFFSNTYEKMKWPLAEIDQFWLFMQKYCSSQTSDSGEKRKQMGAKLLVKWLSIIPDEWNDLDFLYSKVKELNYEKYIDFRAIREFRDVVLMFVDFTQSRKIKQSEKLKVFQQNLPIYQYRNKIVETIQNYAVILIAGDTGCGKSTQVPQYLLKAGYENICCTQPRRLACISLRNRLAVETVDEYGSEIGYQIRFEKHKTKHTKVLFMTEGLLLRQMIEDPLLANYNVIILDEIHERHLSCDFLLGAIKCLLTRRKDDLKVLLMSATVNCELFSQYFGNCPVVKVPGRLYPIKVEYFPVDKFALLKTSSKINPEPYLKLLRHIDDTYSESERGDVLVFLSGYLEIETVGEVLKNYADQTGKWIILYLHSSLPIAEQDKVFDIAPVRVRKCILSTNIAETSLTIDGIRFVIDSGKVKEMYYDAKIRMQKLQEIWVSKASAEQRKGRAGRTGPGVCFRLYSPKEFDAFLDFSTPEIKRVSLESLLLSMISMGINDCRSFPFIEKPDFQCIESTIKCLIDYEALDESEKITLLGQILSKLPVDISIGKMLIIAIGYQLVDFFLSAAACLSVHAFVSNRSLNDLEAIEERRRLNSLEGDLFSYINFYSRWLLERAQGHNTRSWCRRLGLEEQRFFEVTKLRNQFREIVTDTGLIRKNSSERALSKSERMIKHGERKLYHKLKRDYEQHKHKKRKILDVNEPQEQDEEAESQDPEANMKDIEFKLLFDSVYLNEIENRHRLSAQDVQVAKLIVCMSFYPQLAFADLDNSYRTDSDQMFHTKDKPFVVLHPSSVFYNQPELLRPTDIEFSPIGMLSTKHSLLGYISFIETSKTYICNCYPISAIHALLLCSHEIDTNEDMNRLVCDNWIELQCASWEESQDLLVKTLRLRRRWARLLENMFNDLGEISNDDPEYKEIKNNDRKTSFNCEKESAELKHQMTQFLNTKPKYAMKRLLPADLKHLHNQKPMDKNDITKYDHKPIRWLLSKSYQAVANTKKGGLKISYINFNCLQMNQTDEMTRASRKYFECDKCNQKMHLSIIEWARHQELCAQVENEKKASSSQSETTSSNQNRYFCPQCDREFAFSKIDILRHRQMHASS